jgi:nucleoside-diphosphate-sugar epimerase
LSAELLGAPPARFEPYPPGKVVPTEANRRVSNRKAREELGWAPAFPSFAEGLRASV